MLCPECGSMMQPSPEGPICDDCGTEGEGQKVSQSSEGEEITMVDEDEHAHALPKTDEYECEECGERDAYYRTEQTRAADEPTTIILTCAECGNKWRQY
ncbi:transcription factor S [Thermoplasmatales archaeon SW_10_69_26]|nr:MAG: transcription factor S [Thermoplasmatales archaeon SW_10_69_26]